MSDTTDDMEQHDPSEWIHGEPPLPEPEPNAQAAALQLRDPRQPPMSTRVDTTAKQAKVDAIGSLTMSAYAKASELKLTPEEIAGLQKEFPDDAFKTGAAGKENLIYIEHAYLRDRLNEVIGAGQWAIIPRERWGEDFTIPAYGQKPAVDACRVYVEAMMVIRGCFVAEAIGDMTYYKNNASQNYGDAAEGAKTAAFRRCAKELGIGLQAWKKDWVAGWWSRQRPQGRAGGSQSTTQRPPTQPAPQPAPRPPAKSEDVAPSQEADKDQRFRFLAALSSNRAVATGYFVKKGWLKEGQNLEDLPNQHVPTTKKVYDSIVAELQAYADGEQHEPEWKAFLMPWGKCKDTPLGDLDKKYLFGLVKNYTVEEEYNGKRKDEVEIAKDRLFRSMLDAAGDHYEWKKDAK